MIPAFRQCYAWVPGIRLRASILRISVGVSNELRVLPWFALITLAVLSRGAIARLNFDRQKVANSRQQRIQVFVFSAIVCVVLYMKPMKRLFWI
jgi:hypothetical protein